MSFVDLEKAFDRVPRDVLWWSLRVLKVDKWIVKVIQVMYEVVKTSVKINGGMSEEFEVNVGVHQGSALSPLLFIIVMEAMSHELRVGLPWESLYADDLVLMAEKNEKLMAELMVWKNHMEAKGLKVNVGKAKVMGSPVESGLLENSGICLFALCLKSVGANSIKCSVNSGCKRGVAA